MLVLCAVSIVTLPMLSGRPQPRAQSASSTPVVALTNGRWFNGTAFEPRVAMYSVDGRLTLTRPARVDQTIDLTGTWVVPPFGEAHNHNLSNGTTEAEDRVAVRRYLDEGVLYVKSQGNLPPSEELKRRLPINQPGAVEVAFSHGSLTATRGHPTVLVNAVLAAGGFPGHTPESLADLRYFTIDSAADLERKWPALLAYRPDFIKAILVFSEEYDGAAGPLATAPAVVGRTVRRGLNPRLLGAVVARAHADRLRVSTHVSTATDFRHSVEAGVDEIAHLPPRRASAVDEDTTLSSEVARLAARRGITVVTTLALPDSGDATTRAVLRRRQQANLRLLLESGVAVAIGSDEPSDSSLREALYVHGLGVVDTARLLRMWTETTAQTIFPNRRIGRLTEGYEASLLALEGDPIADFQNVRRIRLRVKQGVLIRP